MRQISSIWSGLTKTILIKSGKKADVDCRREATDALVKEATKNDMILRSPGVVIARDSDHLTSVFSKGGKKGVNQDCFIVWEEFGFQEDIIFGGIFDGHGPWGHLVSKRVRKLMPSFLLCNWQETLSEAFLKLSGATPDKSDQSHIWKQAFFRTYSAIDQDLKRQNRIDTFHSGTTALTFVKQGNHIVIANIGDSRAVLATTDDEGSLMPIQLTIDLKPNLPQEASRIRQSKGRVFSAEDEPGVYRVWMPPNKQRNGSSGPGLAISRAFGDYFIKDFGLISEPDFTMWNINTSKDKFIILATDGVWDVLSNEEAVQIVSSTPEKEEAAKRLVERAVSAWKRKKRGYAMDDISAICLFFQPTIENKKQS
ncbi:probable protein phosphatase 2C 34 [Impatiens glandulifera]|uniref:probable protein phosphatase 2C 34 n=1 Tax=Impatiens glandulifera TaxID=253017 RepID=UPI001FB149F9|nr:probable protein phosphatase 2C 34 [Impatiens glandulifera]